MLCCKKQPLVFMLKYLLYMAQQPLRGCSAAAADPAQQLVPPLPGIERTASGHQALRTSPEAGAERVAKTGNSRCLAQAPTIKTAVANAVGSEPSEAGYHRTAEAVSLQGRFSSHQVTESYKMERLNSEQGTCFQFLLFSNALA